LGIGENVLGRWVREAASGKSGAFPGRGVMKPEDAELAQLRKELARTKAERDILKKAIAFFAKDPP
jgi:transposase